LTSILAKATTSEDALMLVTNISAIILALQHPVHATFVIMK
jgi:hypothetical protein